MGAKITSFMLVLGALLASTAQAGLLATDGAGTVEAQQIEIELNGAYTIDKAKNAGMTAKCHSTDGDISVTTGVVKDLDISVALPYTFAAREKENGLLTGKYEGLNDLTLELKYQFFEHEALKLALKPGVILSTGKNSEGLSDGRTGFTTALILTREFAEGKFAVHANAGYERHNYKDQDVDHASRSDIFSFSVAGEVEVAEGLKLQTDFGLATNADNSRNTPPAYAIVGATFGFTKNLEGYAGVKAGLTEPDDDLTALLGLKLIF
jgi:predicted porin